MCHVFAREGARLALVDINLAAAELTRQEITGTKINATTVSPVYELISTCTCTCTVTCTCTYINADIS